MSRRKGTRSAARAISLQLPYLAANASQSFCLAYTGNRRGDNQQIATFCHRVKNERSVGKNDIVSLFAVFTLIHSVNLYLQSKSN